MATSGDSSAQIGDDSFTSSSTKIIVATTVVGGTCVLAILIYALYRQSRVSGRFSIAGFRSRVASRTTLAESQTTYSVRRRSVDIEATASPVKQVFMTTIDVPSPQRTAPLPSRVTQRLDAAHTSFTGFWPASPHRKSSPSQSTTGRSERTRRFRIPIPASPASSVTETDQFFSAKSNAAISNHTPSRSNTTSQTPRSIKEQRLSRLLKPRMVEVYSGPDSPTSLLPASPCTTRDSLNDQVDRWSWTNSQAPPTPKLRPAAPSTHSSLSSMPRFATVQDWVRSQTKRVQKSRAKTEARPPVPIGRRSNFKNQASKPNLLPPPARALSKLRPIRVGSITALPQPYNPTTDKAKPLPSPPGTVPPQVEEQQARWNQNFIEIVEKEGKQRFSLA